LPVVGTDKSVEAPPGVSASPARFRRTSPSFGRPSQGSTASRSAPHGVAATIGSPHPPRRLDDREVFRRPACRRSEDRRRLPQASSPSQGSGTGALPGPAGPGRPSWGSAPLQRLQRRDPYHPGRPRPGTIRPRGFSPPRRFALPCLADSLGPLPLMGFSLVGPFRSARPRRVAASLRPLVHGALQPRTLRNTRSRAPQPPRHLSLSGLVPRPWSQGPQAPFGAPHPRAVAGAFAPAGPLACLCPRRLGEP
jgi:hypothetical protein